ncbi:MAG TPA: DegT/DnrJ/EryC1/StrS family aminotransferase [Planctomycetes bacterium]|nr:DegT/DnrJ/EryC1/StrS family aminotransferase [Planctomycetota bacterium]
MNVLAVGGGAPLVPPGTIRKWPPVDDIDRRYVLESLNGENHAYGPNCTAFQDEFAEWNGNRYAVFTNSGTAALHMGIAACGIGAGDHVLVPAYSWSSSATCVIHHNAIPVFVDIDFDTINMDVSKIEQAITPQTKAIIVVHLHGLAVDMNAVLQVAGKHNLKVIEDACQAHGATVNGRNVGTFGDCAAFSFNQNKCLCTGEGGMFVTNDENMYNLAKQVWSFGETRAPDEARDYHAYALGWMYRGNDLTAAFGRAQLSKLNEYLEIQARNAAALSDELSGVRGLILPSQPPGLGHTYYNYTLRIDMEKLGRTGDKAKFRDAVLKAIQAEGAPVGIWQRFILPSMTVFRAKNAYGGGCPWRCSPANVDYRPEDYPAAALHADTHFGMTVPLRAPNGPDAAAAVGRAIRKVFDNLDGIDSDAAVAGQAANSTL